MRASVGTYVEISGGWHNAPIQDRTSVRHGWADQLEGTSHDWDASQHPYRNWGFESRLDWLLEKVRAL